MLRLNAIIARIPWTTIGQGILAFFLIIEMTFITILGGLLLIVTPLIAVANGFDRGLFWNRLSQASTRVFRSAENAGL